MSSDERPQPAASGSPDIKQQARQIEADSWSLETSPLVTALLLAQDALMLASDNEQAMQAVYVSNHDLANMVSIAARMHNRAAAGSSRGALAIAVPAM